MYPKLSRREFLKLLRTLLVTPLLSRHEPLNAVGLSDSDQDQSAPNVLILILDALSAKNVSLYGYPRDTMPHLARFAEQATVYHAHYASGNFTPPGTASLLTGTYPWTNRAFNHSGTVADHQRDRNIFRAFSGDIYNRIAYTQNLWVAQLLDQFRQDVDVNVNPGAFCLEDGQLYDQVFPDDMLVAYQAFEGFLTPSVELRPGSLFFSLLDDARLSARRRSLGRQYGDLFPRGIPELWKMFFLLEHAIDGVVSLMRDSQKPFLGYFHLLPPHSPYSTRREFIDLFDDGWVPETKEPHFYSDGHSAAYINHQRRRYDEYIAYADAEFGRLCDLMAQASLLDNTYVILTSDHGEMFERGILEHQTPTLYEPVIRIPLVIRRPGQQLREDVQTPTSCIDVLPTLLHMTGQPIPDWCEGELLPRLGGSEANGERAVFALEAKRNAKHAPLAKGTLTMIRGDHKLIHYFGYHGYDDQTELYDLSSDPEELQDLFTSHSATASDLKSELEDKLEEVNRSWM
jgi:arylsulfatase A-like enzyme